MGDENAAIRSNKEPAKFFGQLLFWPITEAAWTTGK